MRKGVAAICGELVPRVAGNPFFLLEMIEALLKRGTLEIVERAAPASSHHDKVVVPGARAAGRDVSRSAAIGAPFPFRTIRRSVTVALARLTRMRTVPW